MLYIPIKSTGDTLTAAEFSSAVSYEETNVITSTNQSLSGSDNYQLSKAISAYSSVGDFCTDTGVANSYNLNPVAPFQQIPFYYNGMRLRFRAGNSNTGASSVNYASAGIKNIKKQGGIVDLTANDIVSGQVCEIIYNSSGSGYFELNPNAIGSLSRRLSKKVDGLVLSNNISNPNTDIDFSSGCFVDSVFSNTFYSSGMTKSLTGTGWVAGNGNCGLPSTVSLSANTWYHAFIIAKLDGTVDFGFDTSITAANLLAEATGYIYYLRRTSIKTDGSSNILPFKQIDKHIQLYNGNIITPAAGISGIQTYTIDSGAPPGVETLAYLYGGGALSAGTDQIVCINNSYMSGIDPDGVIELIHVGNYISTPIYSVGQVIIISPISAQLTLKTLVAAPSAIVGFSLRCNAWTELY